MHGHQSLYSTALDSIISYLKASPYTVPDDTLEEAWKALSEKDSSYIYYDTKKISANDIINNIDDAYRTWKDAPWSKQISFDIFCNYILPYRIANEPFISGWRKRLAEQYQGCLDDVTDVVKAYEQVHCEIMKRFRNHPLGIQYIAPLIYLGDFGTGSCMQACVYEVAVMRSLGIPAAIDFVTHWSNYSRNGHAWCVLPLENGTYTMTKHDTIASRYNIIDSSSFPQPTNLEQTFPYPCDFKKRAAKIWRRTYSHHLSDYNDPDAPQDVTTFFSNPFICDVTIEYVQKSPVIIPDNTIKPKSKYIYLCTYRTEYGWTPIAYSYNKSPFGCINDSIIYLLAYYENKILRPCSYPILPTSPTTTTSLKPDHTTPIDIIIDRKYPLVGKFIDRWAQMRGGRFEASNDYDFQISHLLATIDSTPIYRNVYIPHVHTAYRYARYVSPHNVNFPISELEFYSNGTHITGIPFSNGIENPEMAFDKDFFKTLNGATPGYCIGIDFGKQIRIDSIVMYPQNDDNFIIPDKPYELQYYDSTWISLGRVIPQGYNAKFTNVPSNALLRLHCSTGGEEERIFTWSSNRPCWW